MKCRFFILRLVIACLVVFAFAYIQVMLFEPRINIMLDTPEFNAAPGVHKVCIFPENQTMLCTSDNPVLLVGVKNKGKFPMKIIGLRAYIYRSNEYHHVYQKLNFFLVTVATSTLPASVTATWASVFDVNKSIKGGTYNFVGIIKYCINEHTFQNTFYNGTIEIVVAHDSMSDEELAMIWNLCLLSIFFVVAWCHVFRKYFPEVIQNKSRNGLRRN